MTCYNNSGSKGTVDLRRRLPSFGLLLFLSVGLLVTAPNGFDEKRPRQEQPQMPRFYALQVVSEKEVQNAEDSLGEPDGNYAEILPGGRLVVFMENILFPSRMVGNGETGGCLDAGAIVGKGETDFGLEGRFTWKDSQGEEQHEWIPLAPTVTGFCVFPPPMATYSLEDSAGVDMIRIVNPGNSSLFVDAVIGYEWMFW